MWSRIIKFLLFLLQVSFAFDLPRKCISDLKINNVRYNESESYAIGDGVYPTDAHYDVYGNLFYVESRQDDQGYQFNINVIKFKATLPEKVTGLPEGISYSIAIDKRNTKVYFGTARGMFVYNYDTNSANAVFNSTLHIEMIFIDKNSNKYFVENINGIDELYVLDGNRKIKCQSLEALNEMAIDDKNNFYFIKENRLCVLKAKQTDPTCIADLNYDGMAQISFNDNNVFVASKNLTYFHENDTGNLKVIDEISEKVTAIAFDKTGDFILGVKGRILKYKKKECYVRNRVVDEYTNM